ncbi:hypothetical protein CVT24_006139 [Panaeolus cyanescens]|uniref:DUF7330 domain-containing protein n=1 Tax=Panaeolus cyanescens TaxID=181874 RepID=A0A409WHK3_9AGAR|nr:hypothetical protein CVT24_006139 [Panaeolus cyanescens]
MIIVPETHSEDSKSQTSPRSIPPGQFPDNVTDMNDPPPSYASVTENDASSSLSQIRQPLPPIRASNFTTISVANGAIKGTYAVDPAISIPVANLPALDRGETEENRKNLLLQTNNGSINVELYIAATENETRSVLKRRRTLIAASTRNGSVKVKMHDLSLQEAQRLPVLLTCNTLNGAIELRVPRSFCGPLRLRTWNGSVQFSEAMKPSVTTFSQINKEHRCFLGPLDPHQLDLGPEWLGDEICAESMNGSIKLYYDDETPVPPLNLNVNVNVHQHQLSRAPSISRPMGSKLSRLSKSKKKNFKSNTTSLVQPTEVESSRFVSHLSNRYSPDDVDQPGASTSASANTTHRRTHSKSSMQNIQSTWSETTKMPRYMQRQPSTGPDKVLPVKASSTKQSAAKAAKKTSQPTPPASATQNPATTGVRYKVSSAGFHLRPEEDESEYAVIPEPRRMVKRPATHYDRLGITTGATMTAVDLAYAKAKRSCGSSADEREVDEAYKILRNIKKRKQYDEEIGIARPDGTRIWRPGEYGHPSQIPTGRGFKKKYPHDTGSYASSRYERLPRWEKEEIKVSLYDVNSDLYDAGS